MRVGESDDMMDEMKDPNARLPPGERYCVALST